MSDDHRPSQGQRSMLGDMSERRRLSTAKRKRTESEDGSEERDWETPTEIANQTVNELLYTLGW